MDLTVFVSAKGREEGLTCGHDAVECVTDLQTVQVMFLQPKNTLLLRSESSVPQYVR